MLDKILALEHVRYTEFEEWSKRLSARLCNAVEEHVMKLGRPYRYLNSPHVNKDEIAREVLLKDKVETGLICALGVLEPGRSPRARKDRLTGKIFFKFEQRPQKHYYLYFVDEVFGFMFVRIQTWLPFNTQIYINGREYLARRLTQEGIEFDRVDNCFRKIDDFERAQSLLDELVDVKWAEQLNRLATAANPLHDHLLEKANHPTYWMSQQLEWATDLLFKSASDFEDLMASLTAYATQVMGCRNLLRFLSKNDRRFSGKITSSMKHRFEGFCIKHWVNSNSIKFYNKLLELLRFESTFNDVRDIKVFRTRDNDPDAVPRWMAARKGVVDFRRVTEVANRCNENYMEALAPAELVDTTPIQKALQAMGQPITIEKRRVRGLRILDEFDGSVLEAILDGSLATRGFRNRDLVNRLFPNVRCKTPERKKIAAKISRFLGVLRAHGLIHRIQHTHRYEIAKPERDLIALAVRLRTAPANVLSKRVA